MIIGQVDVYIMQDYIFIGSLEYFGKLYRHQPGDLCYL